MDITKQQERKLNASILSPYIDRIKHKPYFKDGSLLVEKTDQRGRTYFRKLTTEGDYIETYLTF